MGKNERRRKSGVGAFFGGTFFGFLLGLAAVVGIGAFAYFKVSPQWLNTTFKTEIDLGNEEINSKTISDVVNTVVNISNNMDTYTLTDLKNDFGIDFGDKLRGIDISDLKTVPLSDLGGELQNKLMHISIAELEEELITLSGDIKQILNSSYTYYLDGTTLYHDEGHNNEVTDSEFKYTYNSSTSEVVIKGKTFQVANGEVEIGLRYLPLMTALGGFSNLKVGDVMGLKFDGTNYYNDVDGDNINDGGNEDLSNVLKTIAKCKINEMPTKISTLTLSEMFSSSELSSGFFSLIENPEKVLITGATQGEYKSLSDAFGDAFNTSTLGELYTAGVISGTQVGMAIEMYLDTNLGSGTPNYVQLKTLTLPNFIQISLLLMTNEGLLIPAAMLP